MNYLIYAKNKPIKPSLNEAYDIIEYNNTNYNVNNEKYTNKLIENELSCSYLNKLNNIDYNIDDINKSKKEISSKPNNIYIPNLLNNKINTKVKNKITYKKINEIKKYDNYENDGVNEGDGNNGNGVLYTDNSREEEIKNAFLVLLGFLKKRIRINDINEDDKVKYD